MKRSINQKRILGLQQYTQSLIQRRIIVDGIHTALYMPEAIDEARPNVLMIHGLSGSYIGNIPLGQLLAKKYNVYYVDLPGHGGSDTPSAGTMDAIDSWSEKLIVSKMIDEVRIDTVIAHSFGCYVAARSYAQNNIETVFLMPVAKESIANFVTAKVVYGLRAVTIPTYNLVTWSTLRGFMMSHKPNLATWRTLGFVARNTQPGHKKLRYQMQLATRVLPFGLPDASNCAAVIGKYDVIASVSYAKMHRMYPSMRVYSYDGGHLAPIEDAEKVRDLLVKNGLIL